VANTIHDFAQKVNTMKVPNLFETAFHQGHTKTYMANVVQLFS